MFIANVVFKIEFSITKLIYKVRSWLFNSKNSDQCTIMCTCESKQTQLLLVNICMSTKAYNMWFLYHAGPRRKGAEAVKWATA